MDITGAQENKKREINDSKNKFQKSKIAIIYLWG